MPDLKVNERIPRLPADLVGSKMESRVSFLPISEKQKSVHFV